MGDPLSCLFGLPFCDPRFEDEPCEAFMLQPKPTEWPRILRTSWPFALFGSLQSLNLFNSDGLH